MSRFPVFSSVFWLVFVLCACVSNGSETARASIIQNIRIGDHGDKTRIVIDLSNRTQYRTFVVENPNRVVIDVDGGSWQAGSPSVPAKSGLVRNIRHAANTPQTHRIVLETNRMVDIAEHFFLPALQGNGARLVIDIKAGSGRGGVGGDTSAAAGGTSSATTPPLPPSARNTQPAGNNKPLIVIDPGHGGKDSGAISVSGMHEKTLALMFSQELKQSLEATGRYRVHLTRDRDVFIPLRERPLIAQRMQADLFISVHADSFTNPNSRGASLYTLSNVASDREAARLAKRENLADALGGMDLGIETDPVTASILIDLAQRETMNLSARYAGLLVNQLRRQGIRMKQVPHGKAGFLVLTAPDVPSLLLEMGFLSNKEEDWLLKQRSHRNKINKAVVDSINEFFLQQAALKQ